MIAYLDMFIEEASMHGIDLSHLKDGKVEMYFVDTWELNNYSGVSMGYGVDDVIRIYINRNGWSYRDDIDRKFLLFHELGHDVFNFKHNKNELMEPGTLSLDNSQAEAIFAEFWEDAKKIN